MATKVKKTGLKPAAKKGINAQILELSKEINKSATHKYFKKLIENNKCQKFTNT